METMQHATTPPPACRLHVGTSGYSYTEWIEAGFYPPGTPTGGMLPFYARHFSITELNYTWYQMPQAEAMARMAQRVFPGFRFTAKLTRSLTHDVDPDGWRRLAARYRDGIAPLLQSRQLAAVLVQLPPSFDRSPPHRRYLAALLDELAGLPLAVEFRNRSWAADKVFVELERRGAALAAVDEPELPGLFPKLDVVTSPDFFYLRFHGRNARGWRSGNMQQQFDYSYTDAELREWIDGPIARMARHTRHGLVFFNNHVRAQAPQNARQMLRLLRGKRLQRRNGRSTGRMAMSERAIIHLNVADFAVAVERTLDRRLQRRPVIVAPAAAVRAAVYDMSEEAYQAGVRKGMLLRCALRRCRDAAVLPPRPERYERAMAVLVRQALQFSPLIEPGRGDGHLFVDVTGTERLFGPPMDVAWRLRRQARENVRLDPIWSVAPNKLVAKVATRLVKPDGEYIVATGEEAAFLSPVPVELIPGIETPDLHPSAGIQPAPGGGSGGFGPGTAGNSFRQTGRIHLRSRAGRGRLRCPARRPAAAAGGKNPRIRR